MTEIRVLITDYDPLVRVALSHFVSRDPEVTVVGEAENGLEALEAIVSQPQRCNDRREDAQDEWD